MRPSLIVFIILQKGVKRKVFGFIGAFVTGSDLNKHSGNWVLKAQVPVALNV